MSLVGRSRVFLMACCAAALVACGGHAGNPGGPAEGLVPSAVGMHGAAATPQVASTLLYSFTGGSADGGYPYGGLIADKSGNLYGTTNGGGPAGLGTVFKLTPNGATYTESVLYAFAGNGDGELPYGSLVLGKKNVIYGTAYGGGAHGDGCVFALTPKGAAYTESIVYSFSGSPDGGNPYAGLAADAKGTLFGTTLYGGSNGGGTVFALTPKGSSFTESVLYNFGAGSDGNTPYGGVLVSKTGVLFGTTTFGGTAGDGIAYSLTSSGSKYVESVLHNFAGGSDGKNPYAALIGSGTTYFGTTQGGGTGSDGTAFEIVVGKESATETVLYSFLGGSDAAQPLGALLLGAKGALYGTSYSGGTAGQGTVFELSKTKKTYTESVLTSFPGYPGSANPRAGLIANASGALVGTTYGGGTDGYGTIFDLTP